MREIVLLFTAILSIVSTSVQSASTENTPSIKAVTPYPSAEKGQVRYVIFLPAVENEDNFQVELSMGKTLRVNCNSHIMSGNLESKNIKGWGYNYFVLTNVSQLVASTMMDCPDNTPKEVFVVIHNVNHFERYNSKIPIVVYTPKDIEVRYRIWAADDTFMPVD